MGSNDPEIRTPKLDACLAAVPVLNPIAVEIKSDEQRDQLDDE